MSRTSFKTFCVELYAEHKNALGTDIYALFKSNGLLKLLDDDYEDLHGMSVEYLIQFFDDYLGGNTK